jgi:hypothetical protein
MRLAWIVAALAVVGRARADEPRPSVDPAAPRGRPTEIVASFGLNAPTPSRFRTAAEELGYDRRGLRHVYEGEVGALHSPAWWLSVGPVVRGAFGRLGAPYDGVAPIDLAAGTLGARVEAEIFPWPRFFVWMEPSIGVARIAIDQSSKSVGLWQVRGGFGVATARDFASARFRIGWGTGPTFREIGDAGVLDFGGVLFLFDGVIRVAE